MSKNIIKVVDFGLGTFEQVDQYLFKRCGTPGFVAPEVINADKDDPFLRFTSKSDVFSVGIIFFFMLTGQIPYDGDSFSDILANNKKAAIDFDISELHAVEPSALDLLQRMLKINPELRASAEDCLHHPYFEDDCNYLDSSGDTINLTQNLAGIKSKLNQAQKTKFQDSINFNVNPDITGNTDSYTSVSNIIPTIRPKIDSISSKHNQPGSSMKTSAYRQALDRNSAKESFGMSGHKSWASSIDSRKNPTPTISPMVSPGFVQRVSRFANKEKKN